MKMTYAEAVKDAMRCEMLKDPSVFLAGEDISVMGGSFGCSAGLFKEFGPKRIVNTHQRDRDPGPGRRLCHRRHAPHRGADVPGLRRLRHG